jgi:hypothetical protein
VAWFCNATCERLAEKDHRPECDGYKRLDQKAEAPDVEVRLLGRIAYRYKQIQTGEDKTIRDFYTDRTSNRTIMEIWSHEGCKKKIKLADFHKDSRATRTTPNETQSTPFTKIFLHFPCLFFVEHSCLLT